MAFLDRFKKSNQAVKPETMSMEEFSQPGTTPVSSGAQVAANRSQKQVLQPTPASAAQKKPKLRWKRYAIYAGIVGGIIAALLVVMILATITSVDTVVFKSSLSGEILKPDASPVAGATIDLGNGILGTTDINGRYYIGSLELGSYEATITAEGFETIEEEILISRSFLNYSNEFNTLLQPEGEGYIIGKFVVNDRSNYNFINDKLTVNGEPYTILPDGSFTVSNLTTGLNSFRLSATEYTDVVREIDLEAGENDLEDIELTPAGDIVGSLKSYVSEDVVANLEITVEGLPQDQVEKDIEEAMFRIRDLEIGREYRVKITHPDYQTREYTQKAERGENSLFGLHIVRKGRLAFIKKIDNDLEIFSAHYDGEEELQLTKNDFEPYGEYVDTDGILYFMSTRDSVVSSLGGGKALLAYAVPVDGTGNVQRITSNAEGLGQVYPNFTAKKLVQITTSEKGSQDRIVEVMDLSGNSRRQLFQIDSGEISNIQLSDDGNYVVFGVVTGDSAVDGLYRVSTSSAKVELITNKLPAQIFDVSPDGNKILYSSMNPDTELLDLYLFTVGEGKDQRVKNAFAGRQYQFVGDSVSELLYFATESEQTNVYTLNIPTSTEKKLTSFTGTEGVEALYQQGGVILYQTNRGLYVMDFDAPLSGKLVTRDFTRYTGLDF